jgi:hypothetical protein
MKKMRHKRNQRQRFISEKIREKHCQVVSLGQFRQTRSDINAKVGLRFILRAGLHDVFYIFCIQWGLAMPKIIRLQSTVECKRRHCMLSPEFGTDTE